MNREQHHAIQLRESDAGKDQITVYFFDPFTPIWLASGGQVNVWETFDADKMERTKVKGLQAFRTRMPVPVYKGRWSWTISTETWFGAYTKTAHQRTIKLTK